MNVVKKSIATIKWHSDPNVKTRAHVGPRFFMG